MIDASKFDITPDNKEELKKAKEAVTYCQEYMKDKGVYDAPLYDGIKEMH